MAGARRSQPPRPAAEAYVNRGRRDYADRPTGLKLRRRIAQWSTTRYNLSSCRRPWWASVPSYADRDRFYAGQLEQDSGRRPKLELLVGHPQAGLEKLREGRLPEKPFSLTKSLSGWLTLPPVNGIYRSAPGGAGLLEAGVP
jgi:hypothetical protein